MDLGMDKSQWSRWYKSNIVGHEFFEDGKDYLEFDIMSNGNETRDFAVTIEFAKHIAMMAKTQRAHDYRNYFIECEKKAYEKTAQIEPPTQSRLTEVKHGLSEAIEILSILGLEGVDFCVLKNESGESKGFHNRTHKPI